ncbi:MAG: LysR family transcriptional regulator [Ruminiclostridium sp.]|nr:LysR family transcriptional regulator [Ruminiclostridium sp.]
MNFIHLKYAVEIEKAGSVSKAAENLYMGQPNLSKAIKELEKEIGITVFVRTPKGVKPTEQGKEFLRRAKELVNSFDKLSDTYDREKSGMTEFSVAIPRADHIATAFVNLVAAQQDNSSIRLSCKETGNDEIIQRVLNFDAGMGILRLPRDKEKRYFRILDEESVRYRTLWEYDIKILCGKNSVPAEKKGIITASHLSELSELIYSDDSERIYNNAGKTIATGDRAGRNDLLLSLTDAYMWTSPVPQSILERYGLVQLSTDISKRKCKDVLIYRSDYEMSRLDEQFLSELERVREDIMLDKKN